MKYHRFPCVFQPLDYFSGSIFARIATRHQGNGNCKVLINVNLHAIQLTFGGRYQKFDKIALDSE